MRTQDHARIPIVLGVVGHRDIHPEARESLIQALNRLFDEFDKAYPNSPKVLLSPLAPGADQLAAEVALYVNGDRKYYNRRRNWTVRAPLSFAPDDLLRSTSFLSSQNSGTGSPIYDIDAQNKFKALQDEPNNAVVWFLAPVPDEFPVRWEEKDSAGNIIVARGIARRNASGDWDVSYKNGNVITSISTDVILTADRKANPIAAALRSAFYANPGGYIVRHCHTLIALWDAEHSDKPSGTHESVRFQLGGLPLTHYPWTDHEPLGFDGDRGPAIVLYTPRSDDPKNLANSGDRTIRVPCGTDDQYGLHYGKEVDIQTIAKGASLLGNVAKLWARMRLAWGENHKKQEHYDPGKSPKEQSSPEYEQFLAICQAIEDYNSDVSRISEKDKEYAGRLAKAEKISAELFPSSDPLIPAHTANIKPGQPGYSKPIDPNMHHWFLKLSVVRETAAHLSGKLSTKTDSATYKIMLGLFVIVAILHTYAHPPWHFDAHSPPPHNKLWLVLFFCGWATLAFLIVRIWYLRSDDRRIDYRALAEALRVRQAWAVAGLSCSVADSYAPQLRSQLIWVRRALQHICPPPYYWQSQFEELPLDRKLARLKWVRDKWVEDQLKQYKKSSHKNHKLSNRLRRVGFLSFILGLLVLFTPFFLPKADSHGHQSKTEVTGHEKHESNLEHQPTEQIDRKTAEDSEKTKYKKSWEILGTDEHPALFIIFAGGLLMALGAVMVALVEKLGSEVLTKQYDRGYVVFRGAYRELSCMLNPQILRSFRDRVPDLASIDIKSVTNAIKCDEEDVKRAQDVIEALGHEAAHENAQWLLLRRSKPLELPLGG
jgi:hypothetical protein